MQKLYDVNARLIAHLAVSTAGRLVLYDSDYEILGYYYPASDKTYDRDLRLIGRGNQLAALLPQQQQA